MSATQSLICQQLFPLVQLINQNYYNHAQNYIVFFFSHTNNTLWEKDIKNERNSEALASFQALPLYQEGPGNKVRHNNLVMMQLQCMRQLHSPTDTIHMQRKVLIKNNIAIIKANYVNTAYDNCGVVSQFLCNDLPCKLPINVSIHNCFYCTFSGCFTTY